jgi:hypothetical protein
MAQLTKRGLIAAVVCSDSFMKLGTAQAKVFGVPDLPLLKIEHPLGGLSMEKVRERAGVALPQLFKFIRATREKQA